MGKRLTYKEVQKKEGDLTKKQNERCEIVAKKVLQVIANADVTLIPAAGHEERKQFVRDYDPLVVNVMEILKSEKLPVSEWGVVMQMASVPLNHINSYVNESINMNLKRVYANFWGKDMEQITLADVESKLKEIVAKEEGSVI